MTDHGEATQQAQTLEQVRSLILTGELPAGARISERRLCERLGIKRGPVRESLVRLEGEGLVRKALSLAYFVEDYTVEDLADIYTLRRTIERLAAGKAVRQATTEDTVRLRVTCEQEREAFEAGDEATRYACDQRFHRQLVAASGSKLLRRLFGLVTLPVLPQRPLAPERIETTVREHEQLCEALRQRDAARLDRILDRHLGRCAGTGNA
jgi:DNA-binding GntR family transcriptional regulator